MSVPPTMGSGMVQGAREASHAMDAKPVQEQKPGRLLATQYNADTGVTTTPGMFGAFKTDDLMALLDQAKNSPQMAAMILRLARGQSGRGKGFLSADRDKLHGGAFQAALALAGVPGMGSTLQGGADDFLEALQGNDLLGYTSGLGNQVAGLDFSGMDSDVMGELLQAGSALQGLNMGGLGASVRKGQLQDIIWEALERELGNMNADDKGFADLLQNSPFQAAMANFGK